MSEETLDSLQGIAIVGLSGRFPGAPDLETFWDNLRNGVEAISFFTEEELREAGVDPALLADPRYVKAKGILPGCEMFDPAFFGFTPREAELLDPQHRVFLECAWEALENAGYDGERFPGRIAVFGGAGSNAYLLYNLLPNEELLERVGILQAVLMNEGDFLTTRVSYKLNLKGPSVLVQTACSTALVAVHTACQSLLSGESDMALAGGVSIDVPQKGGYLYQESSVASPDGHCRAFDERAAGTVNGSGAGVVVLKRLADAVADGDVVHAVIRGSAINNDGSAKVGFTAPSVEGQSEVIAESLLMAGVDAGSIGYIEAHGSGTSLGDPIEIAALTQAFRAGTDRTGFCALGSVKTNLGHCNAAAGAAGLLKTVLSLEHGEIPPSLHYEKPNPQIDFAGSPFFVNTSLRPWPEGEGRRRAGVSSFGLGGTNAHVVLEEAPPREAGEPSRRPVHLLPVSARTASALETAAANLAARLTADPGLDLADVAFTLGVGRRAFEHRRAVLARTAAEAAEALVDPARSFSGVRQGTAARPVVFLFPGLGDQYVDMARELYDAEPVFREQVDLCADLLTPHLGLDLREVIFSGEGSGEGAAARPAGPAGGADLRAMLRRDAAPQDPAAARLARTDMAQPAHFVVEHALARLLMSWGIVPEAMIGYSIGEYVAACLAGVLSLEDALALVARRARMIEELPAGAMLAVPLPEEEVRPLLTGGLSVSATNGPHFCVVGGTPEEVDALAGLLTGRGVATIRLQTTHAFHSAMMEPAVAAFTEIARRVEMNPPSIPYLSNVTGTWVTPDDLADPGYWARHMHQTVRFAEGVAELLESPDRLFVEVGPGGTLGTLVKQHPDAPAGLVTVSALRSAAEGRSDLEHLLAAVGRLWTSGAQVDWTGLWAGERRLRVELPTYPFERQRCWVDPPRGASVSRAARALSGGGKEGRAPLEDWLWVPVWKEAPAVRRSVKASGSWLLVLDREGLGERLAERLRTEGAEVATVAPGEGLGLPESGEVPSRIVHLASLSREELPFESALESGLAGLVLLEKELQGKGSSPVRIGVFGNRLQEVLDGDAVEPVKAALLGAVKVIHQEATRLTCGAIDIVLPPPGSLAEERLIGQILAEMETEPKPVVAYRGRQRFVRSFERVRIEAGDPAVSPLSEGGVYVVTDGIHGVGPAVAEHLVHALGARVALAVPPDFPTREQWEGWPQVPAGHDPIGGTVLRLLALERAGELDRVLLVREDVASAGGMRSLLAHCRERFGKPEGVFYTGGSFMGGLLQLKTGETLAASLGPLARGAEGLLAALPGDGEGPAFVALCASTLTVTGGMGQLDSAATGSYLDALAQRQAAAGGVPTVAIHWDPYQWDRWLAGGVGGGMIAGLQSEQLQQDLEAHGIPSPESAEALRRLLASGLSRGIVSHEDLETLIAETDAFTTDVFLAEMEKARRSEAPHQRTGLSNPYVPPRDELEEKVAVLWQELFGIEAIGVEDNFLELGGHSLLAIQMMTQVRTLFGVELPVTALFEAPTIAELAAVIAREQAGGEEDPEELEKLLASIEGLSPEEALAKMAELGLAPEGMA
ncbi:MAG TPA: beta-ketoacyl synthase N-terminal-like domain-containing protein [Thermoanaerobaculia bacterium]|nr:beta-ketoacyl synthase N-terminal-like domain-containing protein [Thermoanaerobaculia bacterium]